MFPSNDFSHNPLDILAREDEYTHMYIYICIYLTDQGVYVYQGLTMYFTLATCRLCGLVPRHPSSGCELAQLTPRQGKPGDEATTYSDCL